MSVEIEDDVLNGHAAHGAGGSPGLLEVLGTVSAAALVHAAPAVEVQ